MTAPSITMTRRQIHARIAELNPDNDDDLREIVKLHLDCINLQQMRDRRANRSRGTDGNQRAIAGEGNSAGRDGGEMDSVVRGLDQILMGAGNHAGRDNKIVVTGNIFVLLKPDAGGGYHLPSPLIKGSTYTVAIKYDNV